MTRADYDALPRFDAAAASSGTALTAPLLGLLAPTALLTLLAARGWRRQRL